MEKKLNLVAPWIEFYHEVEALFSRDSEVSVKFNNETNELYIYVDGNQKKAEAIEYIMPRERIFGNVTVEVKVIPSNKPIDNVKDALTYAFEDSPIFRGYREEETPFGTFKYAIFSPAVLQYFNDDTGDIDGKRTATIEDVAREILCLGDNVHICSALSFGFNTPKLKYTPGDPFDW